MESEHLQIRTGDDARISLIASLPPLLLGLGIGLGATIVCRPRYGVPLWRLLVGVAPQLAAAAVLGCGALVALILRLPRWGYTWTGAGCMLVVLGVKVLADELAEVGRPIISPPVDVVIGVLTLVACLAVLGAAAWRGWREAGLVSMGIATVFGLSLFSCLAVPPFNRHDLALLAAPVGLVWAALIYLYIRRSVPVRIAVLVVIGLINAGIACMADLAWHSWYASRGKPSPLLPLLIFLTGSLFAGPLLAAILRPLRRIMTGQAT